MKNIIFGIDIDGTVTDPKTLVPYINEAFSLNLTYEDIVAYDLLKVVPVERDMFNEWYRTKEAEIYKDSPLAEGAKEILLDWARKYRLVFISARGHHLLENTREWFTKHGLPFHHIDLVGSHQKQEAAKAHDVDIFFEDKLDNAIDLHNELGIPVILFNTPYNQGDLPNGVIRVYHWDEAKQWVHAWIKKQNG